MRTVTKENQCRGKCDRVENLEIGAQTHIE